MFDDNDKKKILSSVNVAILKVKEDSGFGLPVERLGIFRHKRIENNNTDTVFEEVALQGKKSIAVSSCARIRNVYACRARSP